MTNQQNEDQMFENDDTTGAKVTSSGGAKFACVPERLWRSLPAKARVYCYLAQRALNDTATWHESYADIGKAIGLSSDAVKKAVRALVADNLIVTAQTRRGDGSNGHLVFCVVERLSGPMTPAEAIAAHADTYRQNIVMCAPVHGGGQSDPRQEGDDSAPTPRDATSLAKNKTDNNKTDINKTDTIHRPSQATGQRWDTTWGDLIDDAFVRLTGNALSRKQKVGFGRSFDRVSSEQGLEVAHSVFIEACRSAQRGECTLHQAIRSGVKDALGWCGYDDEQQYTEALRDRDVQCWTPVITLAFLDAGAIRG